MKPSPARVATSSVFSACCEVCDEKKKLVSGVMPNGNSFSWKCFRYMAGSAGSRLVHTLDAPARRRNVVGPVRVHLHHGGLDEDHQLALAGSLLALAKQGAGQRHVAHAGN